MHKEFIQLSVVNDTQILAVIVTEANVVKNKIIEIEHGLDRETILKLNVLLNTSLNGLTLEQINLGTISALKEEAGIHSDVIGKVLDIVAEAISQEEDVEIYTSGATNFFKYPELSDSEKASELISTFEEKHPLAQLMSGCEGKDENGIQVYIGQEAPLATMRDCSVVTATTRLVVPSPGSASVVSAPRPRRTAISSFSLTGYSYVV